MCVLWCCSFSVVLFQTYGHPLILFCVRQTTTQEDLEFLRNQSITVEVNMARMYNYDVIRRRKAEEAKKASEELKTAA